MNKLIVRFALTSVGNDLLGSIDWIMKPPVLRLAEPPPKPMASVAQRGCCCARQWLAAPGELSRVQRYPPTVRRGNLTYREIIARMTGTLFTFMQTLIKVSITLRSRMNAQLSQQRFWPWHEDRLVTMIPLIPHNLYMSFKSLSLHCGLGYILISLIPHHAVSKPTRTSNV